MSQNTGAVLWEHLRKKLHLRHQDTFSWDTIMPHSTGTCPSAGQCRQVQIARPCLSRQQHLLAGDCASYTILVGPRFARGHGGWHRQPSKQRLSVKNGIRGWRGRFHVNRHYGQDATHMIKQTPVPLWHSPDMHIRSKRDSCWGYNYKNSMALCQQCGSNLPLPLGSPRATKEEGRVFPGVGVSETLAMLHSGLSETLVWGDEER